MNTEARASHDASGPSQRGTAGHPIYNYDSNKDKLLADLKRFATLRTRFEIKLVETRAKIDRTGAAVGEKTKHATAAAHTYVQENPWKPAGVSAAAGVIFALILGRR